MDRTHAHQEKKPKTLTTDSRGTTIDTGLRVAFNRSGDVVIGKIKEVTKNKWKKSRNGLSPKFWWHVDFEMLVECEDGKTSKVRNPNSFVII